MKNFYPKHFHLFVLCALTAGCGVAVSSADATEARTKINWQKMPLLPPEARKAGVFPGGEGGQWPRWSIAVSPADPDFMLLPIDVGGLYRTTDGGAHWNVSMQGWNARGANAFAIDPKNANRVLGIGGNSLNWNADWGQSPHGIYVSSDKALTWKQTLSVPDGLAGQIVFDPTSFSKKQNGCTRAYYSAPVSGFFRSEDGGNSWTKLSDIAASQHNDDYNAALLAVQPKSGWLFLAGKDGLQISKDRGKSFTSVYKNGAVWGLSLVEKTGALYISGVEGVLVSRDSGNTWTALRAQGIERSPGEPIRQITVSPADPQRMFCWHTGPNWAWKRYISVDGGQSFRLIRLEEGLSGKSQKLSAPDSSSEPSAVVGGLAVLPLNARNGQFTWHPKNPNVAFGIGGDWVTRSTDGGQTFGWWNNGYNGIMVGTSFGISPHDTNAVFLAFQDYNGAFTTDGGATWNYRDVSGKGWGGHCYGGFAVDKRVMWYGDADDWNAPRCTRISRDGGATWKFAIDANGKTCDWSGTAVSYADPKNASILFASNWRSTNKGLTWAPMSDCDGVFTSAPDGRLFGRKGDDLVVSIDSGASFRVLVAVPGGIADIAYDHKNDRFYFASQEVLKMWDKGQLSTLETPCDQRGGSKVITVAVDPKNPAIVYAGGPRNVYATSAAVFRSTDAGKTWANLTTGDGPHEVQWIRVHPTTREAWVSGQCYGMWRIAAPKTLGAAPLNMRNAPLQTTVAAPAAN